MLDFVTVKTSTKEGSKRNPEGLITIFPEFVVKRSEDLMIRGGAFYAVWDEDNSIWSKDEGVVCTLVDRMLSEARERYPDDVSIEVKWMRNFGSNKWSEFLKYCGSLPDSYHELDNKLIFSDHEIVKTDYATKKLPYPLKAGNCDAWDELVGTLYDPVERRKLEWAIGAVISGDSKWIQKFVVLYGEAGSGKSTVLNVIEMLFEGYSSTFEAKALGQASNAFALEAFADNPLVSVQHDGDLSRIEDNTKLNSIVSHESLMVNEKFKRSYPKAFNTFLFMGTNKPVKITDAKSGIVRRLIDVRPSGEHIPFERYQVLMAQVRFELGAIAWKCRQLYSKMGANAYDAYRPTEMIGATNDFYNFVEDHYAEFSVENGVTLKQAWEMYKLWSDEVAVKYPMSRRAVKEERKGYFREYHERYKGRDGDYPRCVYIGFKGDKFDYIPMEGDSIPTEASTLDIQSRSSIFDRMCADCPAQYAKSDGTPSLRWSSVQTTLADIDTSRLHYVQVPENHIVIDFDIPGEDGGKDLEANLREAAKWPSTYAELSKSGCGVHLHYIYDGDVTKLAREYKEHVEIKVFTGNSSLRRKLTRCNDIPVGTLSSGLPERKGGKKVLDFEGFKNEKILRYQIEQNLKKAYCPGTKPSVEFIGELLKQAYESGQHYDVEDLYPKVLAFASNSTHWSSKCMKLVDSYHFHSDEASGGVDGSGDIVFFDVEVFPNLFVICWKLKGDHKPVSMVNPTPVDVEKLLKFKLVGFNNRKYDNHILYARLLGYTNEQLYNLSSKMINDKAKVTFAEAYGLSYADIYDFCSKKQSLKKWEIELGIHHLEFALPFTEPVPEELWPKVVEYCINDVVATEAVFDARQDDFHAREMLAELSGLRVNDTNRRHATKIIFGNDHEPQKKFIYTNLATGERSDGTFDPRHFPGYEYSFGKSTYRGQTVGEGGRVFAKPGMYIGRIPTFDVSSMHPASIDALDIFGPYTKNFTDLRDARLAIKHGDYETAGNMLGGKLKPYLGDPERCDKLAYALKIIINSVYGLTAARFDCEFKDPRNVDNIVAKRGALFMMDLHAKVEEMGGEVIHIKTDSIKVFNPTPEIEKFIFEYGKQWGYTFEVESVYSRFCLVNDAVYIAMTEDGEWTATGAEFQHPYIFKTLFTHEPLEFDDFCETKSVTGESVMYLDMDEKLPEGEHDYRFVGRAGQFTPIISGAGGGRLLREKDGKYYAVAGTKGYRWLESEAVRGAGREGDVDISYYEEMAEDAKKDINKFGDYDIFVASEKE